MSDDVSKLKKRIIENEKEMKTAVKKIGKGLNKMHEATGGDMPTPTFSGTEMK